MDAVKATVPLEFQCPECRHIGVTATFELPATLTTNRVQARELVAVPIPETKTTVELTCGNPDCGRTVRFQDIPLRVDDPEATDAGGS